MSSHDDIEQTHESNGGESIAEGIVLRCGHHLHVSRAGMQVTDEQCSDWCEQVVKPALKRIGAAVRHTEIDMSGCQLSDTALETLLAALHVRRKSNAASSAEGLEDAQAADDDHVCLLPVTILRLHNNCISGAGMRLLGYHLSRSSAPLRELHISHNRLIDRSSLSSFLSELAKTGLYPLQLRRKKLVPLYIRLEMCGITEPQKLVHEMASQKIAVCFMGPANPSCSRGRCNAAATEGDGPLFHLHGMMSQDVHRKSSISISGQVPQLLTIRYAVACITSGRCRRARADAAHDVVSLHPLPPLPREVTMRILHFLEERFIKLIGHWGFSCSLCNKEFSFKRYPEAAQHVRLRHHQKRLEALGAGRLVPIDCTGIDASRFTDGLRLRGAFCSLQHVQEARALIPVHEAGVDDAALRAAGARGSWVSPEIVEKALQIALARGVSAEGARHRHSNRRWLLYAPNPGTEWSDELAQELAEIDAFFDAGQLSSNGPAPAA